MIDSLTITLAHPGGDAGSLRVAYKRHDGNRNVYAYEVRADTTADGPLLARGEDLEVPDGDHVEAMRALLDFLHPHGGDFDGRWTPALREWARAAEHSIDGAQAELQTGE